MLFLAASTKAQDKGPWNLENIEATYTDKIDAIPAKITAKAGGRLLVLESMISTKDTDTAISVKDITVAFKAKNSTKRITVQPVAFGLVQDDGTLFITLESIVKARTMKNTNAGAFTVGRETKGGPLTFKLDQSPSRIALVFPVSGDAIPPYDVAFGKQPLGAVLFAEADSKESAKATEKPLKDKELANQNAAAIPIAVGAVSSFVAKGGIQIDIGSSDGLKNGQTLFVIRDGKVIGSLQLLTVSQKRSTAKTLTVEAGIFIRRGDTVSTMPPLPKDVGAKPDAPPMTDQPGEKGRALPETEYTKSDEAFLKGYELFKADKLEACCEPMETAMKLAPNDQQKLKICRVLLGVYHKLDDANKSQPEKIIAFTEFVITHSDQNSERVIARINLFSVVQRRRTVDDLANRYEAVLKQDKNNETAIFILSELYAVLKQDQKRCAELLEQLTEITEKKGAPVNVQEQITLAKQYVDLGKLPEGAELYEQIAPLDPRQEAFLLKNAAQTWLKAKNPDRALAAAKASSSATVPEQRSDQLAHFWHRGLGQIFLKTNEPELAIKHLEAAITKTEIEGYVKDTRRELDEATELLKKQK